MPFADRCPASACSQCRKITGQRAIKVGADAEIILGERPYKQVFVMIDEWKAFHDLTQLDYGNHYRQNAQALLQNCQIEGTLSLLGFESSGDPI